MNGIPHHEAMFNTAGTGPYDLTSVMASSSHQPWSQQQFYPGAGTEPYSRASACNAQGTSSICNTTDEDSTMLFGMRNKAG